MTNQFFFSLLYTSRFPFYLSVHGSDSYGQLRSETVKQFDYYLLLFFFLGEGVHTINIVSP